MFDRFTDRARLTLALARKEAQRIPYGFIGTEHILVGLIRERRGVAARALKDLGVDLKKARGEIQKEMQSGPLRIASCRLPFTPRARKVLELSVEEAHEIGHNYVGTEHLLLGLLREEHGLPARILTGLGLTLDLVRQYILFLLGREIETSPPPLETPGESGSFLTRLLRRLFPSTGDQ